MPDIPVDRKNDDPAVVFAWIQSLMCDPKDVNGVRSWIALLSSPDSNFKHAAIQSRLKEANAAAIPAALVFFHHLRLQIHLPSHASIRKAQDLTKEILKLDKKLHGGREGKTSLKAVRKSWKRFRQVAHFWLADVLFHGSVKTDTDEGLDAWVKVLIKASDHMLAVAENVGLDNFVDPWRLPGAPAAIPSITGFPPLTAWERKVMSRYVVRR